MTKQLLGVELYLVYVDSELCDGCAECARYCPVDVFNVLDVYHKVIAVRPQNCLGCGACEAVCHSKAIVITEI